MRIVGIDLGSVRTGLAVSDELGITASPMKHLRTRDVHGDLVGAVAEIGRELGAGMFVVGNPLRMDGEPGSKAREALEFADALAARTGLRVALWDERLSTKQAERDLIKAGMRRTKRKDRIDSVAAALMLQSYLDARGLDPGAAG